MAAVSTAGPLCLLGLCENQLNKLKTAEYHKDKVKRKVQCSPEINN